MLRGLVWNCRGIGDVEKRKFIKEQINLNSLDVAGIHETMKQEFSPLELSVLSGQDNFDWTFLPPRGRSSGILVGINNNTLVKDNHELGEYYVKLNVKNVVDDFC